LTLREEVLHFVCLEYNLIKHIKCNYFHVYIIYVLIYPFLRGLHSLTAPFGISFILIPWGLLVSSPVGRNESPRPQL
jgi:hypothetical protein